MAQESLAAGTSAVPTIDANEPCSSSSTPLRENRSEQVLKDEETVQEDSVETEEPLLNLNLPTGVKAKKRKRLLQRNFDESALPDFVQEARKQEKERLERLLKFRPQTEASASTYEVKYVDNEKPNDAEQDDDVLVECVVEKKRKIEVVDLSSDEEAPEPDDLESRMHREEDLRVTRNRRKLDTLDKVELTPEGRLLVNEGKPKADPNVFVAAHLTHVLQPHQLGGGFGCILAHSMGLGKTIQVITFVDIFFRTTRCRKALVICPVNVLQNWGNEFEKWLPIDTGKRDFSVFLLGDAVKSTAQRIEMVSNWNDHGGVLLLGYEMFRLLVPATQRQPKKSMSDNEKRLQDRLTEVCKMALIDPGPDLVICDEGHRIKNLKTECSLSLAAIRTKRRIVLTGYPLQNNLMEYYCMVNFVRPMFLGDKKTFSIMFEKPIKNAMCIDSTKRDIKLARQRTHVLTRMVKGFVQRRTQHLLKKILPESREYVVVIRKTEVQKELYKRFLLYVKDELSSDATYYNPLKAYAICSKIWNHPDLLYQAWRRQLEVVEERLQKSAQQFPAPSNSILAPESAYYGMQGIFGNQYGLPPMNGNGYQGSSSVTNGVFPSSVQCTPPRSPDSNKKKGKKKQNNNLSAWDEDDNSVPYYWADDVMGNYQPGIFTHSYKILVALTIIEATILKGEKILLFSGSLLTLSLIEDFLKLRGVVSAPNGPMIWKKNETYFRFDGSTSGADREKLIDRFNADPSVRLFLISTRAGSLGVNLVSATRVIIFDASWNPCHDSQAVCRIYRYGQKNKTFIYRLIVDNCMERAIFARQISKHGLQQRVVDEQSIDANVTTKELETLIAYDEAKDLAVEHADLDMWKEKIDDDLLQDIVMSDPTIFSECPFLHESLMLEQEEKLSAAELMEADILYEREKRNMSMGGISVRPPIYSNYTPMPTYRPPLPMPSPYYNGNYNNQPTTIKSLLNNMHTSGHEYDGTMASVSPFNGSYNAMPSWMPSQPLNRPAPLPRGIVVNAGGVQPHRFPTDRTNEMAPSPFRRSTPSPTTNKMTQSQKRGNFVLHNRRAIYITLSCINKPGKSALVKKGDPVLIVKTTTGGVYLRTTDGQILDAFNTEYAREPQVIDID